MATRSRPSRSISRSVPSTSTTTSAAAITVAASPNPSVLLPITVQPCQATPPHGASLLCPSAVSPRREKKELVGQSAQCHGPNLRKRHVAWQLHRVRDARKHRHNQGRPARIVALRLPRQRPVHSALRSVGCRRCAAPPSAPWLRTEQRDRFVGEWAYDGDLQEAVYRALAQRDRIRPRPPATPWCSARIHATHIRADSWQAAKHRCRS